MKYTLFILVTLCLWIPGTSVSGIPKLLPWPQQIEWNRETFQAKEVSLLLNGESEKIITDWLTENDIKINPSSRKQIEVKRVNSMPEATVNAHEAYKLKITSNRITIEATTGQGVFRAYPFAYVKQTNVKWRITDAFPNDGDLCRIFPPESGLEKTYRYEGKTYDTQDVTGAGIYLRHVWGTLVPGVYKNPEENHTAYAWTWVYSPKAQQTGVWIEFQNYGRSEMDLAPQPGKWDYKESRVWLNDKEILPPDWTATHRIKSNEIPIGIEIETIKSVTPIDLISLKKVDANFHPPQVYGYVTNEQICETITKFLALK